MEILQHVYVIINNTVGEAVITKYIGFSDDAFTNYYNLITINSKTEIEKSSNDIFSTREEALDRLKSDLTDQLNKIEIDIIEMERKRLDIQEKLTNISEELNPEVLIDANDLNWHNESIKHDE